MILTNDMKASLQRVKCKQPEIKVRIFFFRRENRRADYIENHIWESASLAIYCFSKVNALCWADDTIMSLERSQGLD